ncbi:MAG: c-type cytochrome [Candidatus Methylomirabilales bacterium]
MRRSLLWILPLAGLLTGFLFLINPGGLMRSSGDPVKAQGRPSTQILERGREVYERNCAVCHGQNGDGNGMAAHMFRTRPRDFTKGIFKFRSTSYGSLPTDEDLFRIISRGIRWTAMVAQDHLSEEDRWAVIQYVKTFSPRFQVEHPEAPMPVPKPPPKTKGLVAQGRETYEKAECGECHGRSGRGDGPSAEKLKDEWGDPIRPSDLTRRPFKGGSIPRDLFRTLITGLGGTPMPSYRDALTDEELWALVYYLLSLSKDGSLEQAMVGEERMGWMVEQMHRMMGPGMMDEMRRRMPMMPGMPMR